MIYAICASGLHRTIAAEIETTSKEETTIVSVDKNIKSLLSFLRNFYQLILCILDKNSHVIIPHPFNPWFSIFARMAKNVSIMDDGVAYYYSAKIPDNIYCKIYKIVSHSRLGSNLAQSTENISYPEFLSSCETLSYYCLFPKLSKIHHINTIQIKPSTTEIYDDGLERIIFLDSSPEIAKEIDIPRTIEYLRNLSKTTKIFIKGHPRHKSPIFQKIMSEPWITVIGEEFESFLKMKKITALYSIYSSATITCHLLQPDAHLFCFTSEPLIQRTKELHSIFEYMHVEFVKH